MCKKASAFFPNAKHIQISNGKLIPDFHQHRYLKRIVTEIRLCLAGLDAEDSSVKNRNYTSSSP